MVETENKAQDGMTITAAEIVLLTKCYPAIYLDPRKEYPLTTYVEWFKEYSGAYGTPPHGLMGCAPNGGQPDPDIKLSDQGFDDASRILWNTFHCFGHAVEVPANTTVINPDRRYFCGDSIFFSNTGLAIFDDSYDYNMGRVVRIMDGYKSENFPDASDFSNFLKNKKRFEQLVPDEKDRDLLLSYALREHGRDDYCFRAMNLLLTDYSKYPIYDSKTQKWQFENPYAQKNFLELVERAKNIELHYRALPEELREEYDNMYGEQKMRFRNANHWNDPMPKEPQTVMNANETGKAREKNATVVQEGSERKMA